MLRRCWPSAQDASPILGRWPRRNGLFVDGGSDIEHRLQRPGGDRAGALDPDSAVARALAAASRQSAGRGTASVGDQSPGQRRSRAGRGRTARSAGSSPTGWCMLALKRLAARSRPTPTCVPAFEDGERLLADRVCRTAAGTTATRTCSAPSSAVRPDDRACAAGAARSSRRRSSSWRRACAYLASGQLDEHGGLALSLDPHLPRRVRRAGRTTSEALTDRVDAHARFSATCTSRRSRSTRRPPSSIGYEAFRV